MEVRWAVRFCRGRHGRWCVDLASFAISFTTLPFLSKVVVMMTKLAWRGSVSVAKVQPALCLDAEFESVVVVRVRGKRQRHRVIDHGAGRGRVQVECQLPRGCGRIDPCRAPETK